MTSQTPSSKVKKSLSIILEMLSYRNLSNAKSFTNAIKQLRDYIEQEKWHHDLIKNDFFIDVDNIRIIYNLDEKWDPRQLKQNRMQVLNHKNEKVERYLIVLTKPVVKTLLGRNTETIDYIHKSKKIGEIFHLDELQYNLTKHFLVPKHERIEDEKMKESLLNDFELKALSQFPLILSSDPVARFIGAKPGDLIKITRVQNQVGEHIVYRYCVLDLR